MPQFRNLLPVNKHKLIELMSSRDNAVALKALAELRERLCFQDGTMHGVDLRQANLTDARLARASLRAVILREATLTGAYFGASDLQQADLQAARLMNANLREVNLYAADLTGADLQGAHLAQANLRGATLRRANLRGANLWRAQLQGADLTDATLTGVNFYLTEFDAQTILPDGAFWSPAADMRRYTDTI